MEGLSPPLKCLIEMRSALQNGEPARAGVVRYLASVSVSDDYAPIVRRFLFAWDQGQDWRSIISSAQSAHRRALLDLLASAMAGQPILQHLDELRSELIDATNSEIQRHLELLPIKMLIPLLFLQFPAFLLLLFGPLLLKLLEEINK